MSAIANLNLMPSELRAGRIQRARRQRWAVVIVLTMLVALLSMQWSAQQGEAVRQARAVLDHVAGRQRTEYTLRRELDHRAAQLASDSAALLEICAGEAWAERLARLARMTPVTISLTRLALTNPTPAAAGAVPPPSQAAKRAAEPRATTAAPSPQERVIEIEGDAADYRDIALFARRLEDSGLFSAVSLTRSTRSRDDQTHLYSFSFQCRLAADKQPAEEGT
ncbi:MAG: hypothetical protein CHACPFDD_00016 [Phycisphaerae bacterium]|nr:hypothetical protein [Phycisphaerae bacterium]